MTTYQIESGTSQYAVTTSFDKYVLGERATLSVSDTNAIFNDTDYVDDKIVINGQVRCTADGFDAMISNATGTSFLIGSDGSVTGASGGVRMLGTNEILVNHGLIDGGQGDGVGVGNGAVDASVTNTGTIIANGPYSAIEVFGSGTEVHNSGKLYGDHGIYSYGGHNTITLDATSFISATTGIYNKAGDDLHIVNAGRIIAGSAIVVNDSTRIVNTGVIEGTIMLSGGGDSFDNRGGTIDNSVYGGYGDDVLITDKASDYLYENPDQGADTVKSTVSYRLTGNVENLVLLGHADIKGTGNIEANSLRGNSGDNVLAGGVGADSLDGRGGADKLIGGADADRFIFATGFGKDTIKDFEDGIDVIDLSGWKAISDFNDVKQHLTVSGGDLIIKAGDDWLTVDNLQKSGFTAADVDFMH